MLQLQLMRSEVHTMMSSACRQQQLAAGPHCARAGVDRGLQHSALQAKQVPHVHRLPEAHLQGCRAALSPQLSQYSCTAAAHRQHCPSQLRERLT